MARERVGREGTGPSFPRRCKKLRRCHYSRITMLCLVVAIVVVAVLFLLVLFWFYFFLGLLLLLLFAAVAFVRDN